MQIDRSSLIFLLAVRRDAVIPGESVDIEHYDHSRSQDTFAQWQKIRQVDAIDELRWIQS